ncbi:glycosyltransferase family 4 protein [Aquimarina algicola]|uniref:Glycosyltransferase family 4 protein n=1 Tax=Aquimarina algicola TaxID=2589995 RepID=A0A504JE70_9FLAO|nr:glycosyltransferase family 4 protein [Aquimarina algicola]TPN89137.1 glycosyltransferase family 4 protein [Aquimarina algicola]
MKLVFLIDQVYLHGGIERVLSIKANYLAALDNYEVFIITTEQKNNSACYEFDNRIKFQDIAINYNRKKSYFHPDNLKKLPKHIRRTKAALKKINPDVVVVCSHSVDTYFTPFINKRIPKVKEFHYSKYIELEKRRNPGSLFKKYFLKFADYVEGKYDKLVVLNPDEATYYKTGNTIVIPNPLTFYPENISDVSQKVVIAAGRIAPVKGYDILIDIWETIHKERKDWQLHIYGNGEKTYIKELQDKIHQKKLETTLILQGPTSDMKGKMQMSSIFAMTSHNECFPLVLLEAQACGLPIISFDCPHGPRNIIDDTNGLLIPLYDQKAFSNQLLEAMDSPEKLRRMGKNAREHALRFEVRHIMNIWINMFTALSN